MKEKESDVLKETGAGEVVARTPKSRASFEASAGRFLFP